MGVLRKIVVDNWEWREQIFHLALFDLKKQSRGSLLGWVWFVARPIVYIFCFWFALDIGLKAGRTAPGEAPYILWLSAGIIPWFFMQDMLGGGIDVLKRYSYLVKKVKFPLTAISSVYTLSSLFVWLIRLLVLVVVYIACGQPLDIYLLQVPVLIVVMYVFWVFFSILMSPLCAMSKDLKNLMNALSTPLFWLSGVIFRVRDIDVAWMQNLLMFNPITFFVEAFRDAVYLKVWVWESPQLCICFAIVFFATIAAALFVHKHTYKEVADVL